LWVGTIEGVDVLDLKTNSFMYYQHVEDNVQGLGNNIMLTIFHDSSETIWVGTAGDGSINLIRKIQVSSVTALNKACPMIMSMVCWKMIMGFYG